MSWPSGEGYWRRGLEARNQNYALELDIKRQTAHDIGDFISAITTYR
jgi:phage-related protein